MLLTVEDRGLGGSTSRPCPGKSQPAEIVDGRAALAGLFELERAQVGLRGHGRAGSGRRVRAKDRISMPSKAKTGKSHAFLYCEIASIAPFRFDTRHDFVVSLSVLEIRAHVYSVIDPHTTERVKREVPEGSGYWELSSQEVLSHV